MAAIDFSALAAAFDASNIVTTVLAIGAVMLIPIVAMVGVVMVLDMVGDGVSEMASAYRRRKWAGYMDGEDNDETLPPEMDELYGGMASYGLAELPALGGKDWSEPVSFDSFEVPER